MSVRPDTTVLSRSGFEVAHRPAEIAVRNVWRRVGARVLLHDVSLDVHRGELVAIAGPSGAGKSTLLMTMAGLVAADAGTVVHATAKGHIGFVPQEDIIHRGLPLRKTLRYAAQLRLDAPRSVVDHVVDELVRRLDLDAHGDVRVGALSGGQRKRASLAVELLGRPHSCFLDEPTTGLDPVNAAGVMRSLRALTEAGVTVVMTTHDPSQLDEVDRVVFVASGGRIAFVGSPDAARVAFAVDRLSDVYRELSHHER